MENNCFVLKLKDSVLGNYDKLNFLKIKAHNGSTLIFALDKMGDIQVIAEGCVFSSQYYLLVDITEHTFSGIGAYSNLSLSIKGEGYLYVSNKYNLGNYWVLDIDLNKIYSLDKAIKIFSASSEKYTNHVKGNINHLLLLCSPNLTLLVLKMSNSSDVTIEDITEICKFTNLTLLTLANKIFTGNISIFSLLINLTSLALYGSNMKGNIEELVLTWYNNGKTTGTVRFLFSNTLITVPSTISDKGSFYCTFTEEGYTFSLTNPNT